MVMASLDHEEELLRTLNYGDSGYLLLRPNSSNTDVEKIFRTEEQQHYFNCPYQCGTRSRPGFANKAQSYMHNVKEGDLIVMGSDGLLDNLYDKDIIDCIKGVGIEKSVEA